MGRARSTDGRWLGSAVVGYGPDGRVRRKHVSATTRAEVSRRLKELQRQLDDGLPPPDSQLTVAQLLER